MTIRDAEVRTTSVHTLRHSKTRIEVECGNGASGRMRQEQRMLFRMNQDPDSSTDHYNYKVENDVGVVQGHNQSSGYRQREQPWLD